MKKFDFKAWLRGDVDINAALANEEKPISARVEEPKLKRMTKLEKTELKLSNATYKIFGTIFCTLFIGVLIITTILLPSMGGSDIPTVNEVMVEYVENGTEKTGAVNTVAGMILDYRAFDTLGESFVLFTATCAVLILMKESAPRRPHHTDRVPYVKDDIIYTVCRFIVPVIFIMGVYVLLNGHLSPGGGFSGGAILGSALILYALVYGEDKAAKVFSPRLIKTVTACSLSFYALSKAYSFFTGANHLHSIIGPGTPGRIFSAGLILPLNIAVGFVVCCTMYTFYMLFRRGSIK